MIDWILDNFLEVILAIATVFLAIYTYGLLKETKKMRQAQIQPYLSFYIKHLENDVTIYSLEFENIGNGSAKDVKFQFTDGTLAKQTVPFELGEKGLFINGIGFCPPNYKQSFILGSASGDGNKDFMSSVINIKASYRDVLDNKHTQEFCIKLSEVDKTSTIYRGTFMGEISHSLKEIKKEITKKNK